MTQLPLPLYYVGLILLYMPPSILFFFENQLSPLFNKVNDRVVGAVALGLMTLMIFLLREAWGAFIFYYFTFIIIYSISNHHIENNRYLSVSLAVYACFAVSVLWEWPIQLTIPQNGYALAMSLFKGLGVVFFFYTLYSLRWRPSRYFIVNSLSIITIGFGITFWIITLGINDTVVFWMTHLYRIPWLLILMMELTRIHIYFPRFET